MRSVKVYLNTQKIGILTEESSRGGEVYSFSYDTVWLHQHPNAYFGNEIQPYQGKQYFDHFPGCFSDCAPDRWGRTLIQLANPGKHLTEMDYLLDLSDYLRTGAFRFSDGQQFLTSDGTKIPPMFSLRELEQASFDLEHDRISDSLQKILIQGSSLGGARPKANVIDTDGSLWIAKFPSRNDTYDVGAWEAVENELARLCGLNVTETKAIRLSDRGSTFLSKRFDRAGEIRVPYISAMTLLGASDGNPDNFGYLDMVDTMETNGMGQNLPELFHRIAFSMLTGNTDDHLRNHGYLYQNGTWRLSPVFDINPNMESLQHAMYRNDGWESVENLVQDAPLFRVTEQDAKKFIQNSSAAIRDNLERLCARYKIPKGRRNRLHPVNLDIVHEPQASNFSLDKWIQEQNLYKQEYIEKSQPERNTARNVRDSGHDAI